VVAMAMATEEWEIRPVRQQLWEGEGGERWQTWSTKLQRNGLWTFPERTRRFGRRRSAGARVGARGISGVVVVLLLLEFVGQHCEVRVQFEWKGGGCSTKVLISIPSIPQLSAVAQSMEEVYASPLDKRSRPLVLPNVESDSRRTRFVSHGHGLAAQIRLQYGTIARGVGVL
jgi:hypothetical protein